MRVKRTQASQAAAQDPATPSDQHGPSTGPSVASVVRQLQRKVKLRQTAYSKWLKRLLRRISLITTKQERGGFLFLVMSNAGRFKFCYGGAALARLMRDQPAAVTGIEMLMKGCLMGSQKAASAIINAAHKGAKVKTVEAVLQRGLDAGILAAGQLAQLLELKDAELPGLVPLQLHAAPSKAKASASSEASSEMEGAAGSDDSGSDSGASDDENSESESEVRMRSACMGRHRVVAIGDLTHR